MTENRRRRVGLLLLTALAVLASYRADAGTLVLTGGQIYASPEADALAAGVVVSTDGVITAIGRSGEVAIPPDADVIDCSSKTVVAGFWNSHVHFTEAVWKDAAAAPAAPLQEHMQEMLTRWGFTAVWDLGSEPADTLALRRRIAAGEIRGPAIFLAGSIFPKGGHPVYLPAAMILPEAADAAQAARFADRYMSMGLDGLKLFTGAYMGDRPVVTMDADAAKAAVDIVHGAGKPVFAHPQTSLGIDIAVGAGVDALAHIVPGLPAYSAEQLARFRQQNTALIPTLSLFAKSIGGPALGERLAASGVAQLKAFANNGGPVLFGTDVGFTNFYDTALEYELMHRALSEREVLASLTTNPARYFKAAKKGELLTGFDADIVVLDGDPMKDVGNLARVAYTIRAGSVIYRKP